MKNLLHSTQIASFRLMPPPPPHRLFRNSSSKSNSKNPPAVSCQGRHHGGLKEGGARGDFQKSSILSTENLHHGESRWRNSQKVA